VVWHHSLPLMNSFNKTEAAVFSCRLCFLRVFPFISLIALTFWFGVCTWGYQCFRIYLVRAVVSLLIDILKYYLIKMLTLTRRYCMRKNTFLYITHLEVKCQMCLRLCYLTMNRFLHFLHKW